MLEEYVMKPQVNSSSPDPEPKPDGLYEESVAGEEDPGAAVEPPPMRPGDEAPAGTPGTGEGLCRTCGGSGRIADGRPCPDCGGTGKITVGIGGA
jgi:hypothetical protein